MNLPNIRIEFDAAAFEREKRAARAWTRAELACDQEIDCRDESARPARFNVISLAAWLAVARRAEIAFIPAREILSFPLATYTGALSHEPQASKDMDVAEAKIISGLGGDEILRFDQVAPGEVKADRSQGRELGRGTCLIPEEGREILSIYEDRFYSTMMDHGGDTIRAYGRPRQPAVLIEGVFEGASGLWPAEFRVFIENGQVVGISNYYPQVDMDEGRFSGAVRDALSKAQAMLKTMDRLHLGVGNARLAPDDGPIQGEPRPAWMPAHWGPQDFTLDFFAISESETVFLEGGPAGLRAAHPCCFAQDGRSVSANFLHGAVFSPAGPIHPIRDYL